MRIVILTSNAVGFASVCLPVLAKTPGLQVVSVVLAGSPPRSRRMLHRKLVKTLRIGPLGALNGARMRRWYNEDVQARLALQSIDGLAAAHGIPVVQTPHVNAPETLDALRATEADLALSLGNGYIAERVFSIPRHGTINVHHEVLPAFQGAQSVLWQLYHGSSETGYTVHEVNRTIDGGRILYGERRPILFQPTLAETVSASYADLLVASANGLAHVCTHFESLRTHAQPQSTGHAYTTPSIWQFWRMQRNYRRLRAANCL